MLLAEGKLDAALDHLNSNKIQQFLNRLWEYENASIPADDREGHECEGQEVSTVQDTCMSVTNSVLRHTQFQEMVRNKDISYDVRSKLL
jgi:hypothetical protein